MVVGTNREKHYFEKGENRFYENSCIFAGDLVLILSQSKVMFMRKKVIVASLILCSMLCSGSMYALDREKQISLRNEVRVGWGDMLYETAMYHTTWTTNNYRYTGHLFAEYQHWFKRWLSVGV